jgi:uncharacterized protein (DUF433 family)
MAVDWSECPADGRIPGKVGGAWLCKGSRTPVSVAFHNLQSGMTIDEIIEQFPVSREEIQALLDFSARSIDVPVSVS